MDVTIDYVLQRLVHPCLLDCGPLPFLSLRVLSTVCTDGTWEMKSVASQTCQENYLQEH